MGRAPMFGERWKKVKGLSEPESHSTRKELGVAFLRSAALPQHMAERLCLSDATILISFEATPRIGGVAAK